MSTLHDKGYTKGRQSVSGAKSMAFNAVPATSAAKHQAVSNPALVGKGMTVAYTKKATLNRSAQAFVKTVDLVHSWCTWYAPLLVEQLTASQDTCQVRDSTAANMNLICSSRLRMTPCSKRYSTCGNCYPSLTCQSAGSRSSLVPATHASLPCQARRKLVQQIIPQVQLSVYTVSACWHSGTSLQHA